MQRQFGSMVVVADAYRQELLADAARARAVPAHAAPRRASWRRFGRGRQAVRAALARVGPHGVGPLSARSRVGTAPATSDASIST